MGFSNKPRAINSVSILLYIALAGALYGGWKYGPPYYQSYQVGNALDEVRRDAGRFVVGIGDPREEPLLTNLYMSVLDLGVDESTLEVYFGPDSLSLHVEYTVVIHHLAGDPVEKHVHRQIEIEAVGR